MHKVNLIEERTIFDQNISSFYKTSKTFKTSLKNSVIDILISNEYSLYFPCSNHKKYLLLP